MKNQIKIGDRIRDLEDVDCYYEGVVVSVEPLIYRIDTIVWDGESETVLTNEETRPKWWLHYILNQGEWNQIKLN